MIRCLERDNPPNEVGGYLGVNMISISFGIRKKGIYAIT